MMTVTASTFRDSGIEWLPKTPSHWEMKRLKFTARFFGGSTPSTDNAEFWDGDIPWVSPKDMRTPRITDSEDHITKAALASSACRLVPKDAVLIVVRSGILRHSIPVAINRVDVALNQDMKAIIPMPCLRPEYLCHLITGLQRALLLEWRKQGATVESIEHELLANWMVPLPPVEEQERITRFLDDRCAQIDEIIAKKQRLIELLEEQKAALITRAVTRGLDPSVPMKDSGIPWLGQVPDHWELRRLKHIRSYITSGSRGWAEHYADDGPVFLRIGNLTRTGIGLDLTDIQRVAPPSNAEGERTMVQSGDVLISITADIGSVAVVPDNFERAYVNQHIALVRLWRDKVIPRFAGFAVRSGAVQCQIHQSLYGGTKQGLGLDDVDNIRIPLPPMVEQEAIVTFLSESIARMERAQADIYNQCYLLLEYRSALITAAVTGQLDVITAA